MVFSERRSHPTSATRAAAFEEAEIHENSAVLACVEPAKLGSSRWAMAPLAVGFSGSGGGTRDLEHVGVGEKTRDCP